MQGETVSAVATRFGFSHPPRFAAQYRRRYGEPPSATLERGRALLIEVRRVPDLGRRGPAILVMPLTAGDSVAQAEEREFARSLIGHLAAALSRVSSGPVRQLRMGDQPSLGSASNCYAVAGHVTRSRDRLRVVLRLFDTADAVHLWGDAFDGATGDPLALQDSAIAAAVTAITARVADAEADRAWSTPPELLVARDLVIRAVSLIRLNDVDNTERAFDLAMQASELDPTDGAAAALLGVCQARRVSLGGSTDWARDRTAALRHGERAAALAPDNPLVLTARSMIALTVGDHVGAEALTARALAMSPGSALAWERSGYLHVQTGNFVVGMEHFHRSISLSGSRSSIIGCLNGMAQGSLWEGRPEEAASLSLQALALNPHAVAPRRFLPACYALLGLDGEARRAIHRLRVMNRDISQSWFARANPSLEWSATRTLFKMRLAQRLAKLGMPP
jgi:adenylate cyclase